MLEDDRFDGRDGPGASSGDAATPCERFGPDIVALARGEDAADLDPAALEHGAVCPACRSIAGDAAMVFRAAAARPAPVPFAGLDPVARRAAIVALVDHASDAARKSIHDDPLLSAPVLDETAPALRLVVTRRYAESRLVRFLSLSAGLHAAAAAVLGAWLYFSPSSPFHRGGESSTVVEVGTETSLQTEGEGSTASPPGQRDPFGTHRTVDFPGAGEKSLPEHTGLTPFDETPRPDFGGEVAINAYPTEAFRQFASARFLPEARRRRMEDVFGEAGGADAMAAIGRGLRRLAASQEQDGTWADPSTATAPGRRGTDTAAAVRAFLSEGETALRRGLYSELVRRGIESLARSRDAGNGLLGDFRDAQERRIGGAGTPTLVDHAAVLSTLAEAYGLDFGLLPEDARGHWRALLTDAVQTVVTAQRPDGSFGLDGRGGDTQTTLHQVEALAMARMVGIEFDGAVLKRAGEFVRSRIDEKGTLGLTETGDRGGDASLAARALLLAEPLSLTADERTLLRHRVLEDASGDSLKGRALFRADLLELVAASDDRALRDLWGPHLSRMTVSSMEDRQEDGGGRTVAMAVAVRGLTAPFRCPAP